VYDINARCSLGLIKWNRNPEWVFNLVSFFNRDRKDRAVIPQMLCVFQRLSKNYHMMWSNSDWLWKDLLYRIPFILWKSILTLIGSKWCSVIQVTLLLVNWLVGC
jgi:hypothetical protein